MKTKKSTYHHGNLREVLISSALEILKEGTLRDLSLRALARKAGVSQTAPYRHFQDKEALIVVLMEDGGILLQDYMQKAYDATNDPIERLENIGVSYYDFSYDYPAHFRLMFGGSLEDKSKYSCLMKNEEQSQALLRSVITDCMKLSGAPKADPDIVKLASWSLVHGLATLILNEALKDKALDDKSKRVIVSDVVSFYTRSIFKK